MQGMSYSIEAVMAIVIISIAALPLLSGTSSNIDYAKENAYQKLQYLSANSQFREFIYQGNPDGLEGLLDSQFDDYESEVCNPACAGPSRIAKESFIIDWYIAGYHSAIGPRTLRLYLYGI